MCSFVCFGLFSFKARMCCGRTPESSDSHLAPSGAAVATLRRRDASLSRRFPGAGLGAAQAQERGAAWEASGAADLTRVNVSHVAIIR